MAQLDDFIREQFDRDNPGERFPFREEHWAQALPLIEAAEQKRRRRGLLWWLLCLVVLCGGWWGWCIVHTSSAAVHQPATVPQETLIGSNSPTEPMIYDASYSSDNLEPIKEWLPVSHHAKQISGTMAEVPENDSVEKHDSTTFTKLLKFSKRDASTENLKQVIDNQNFKSNSIAANTSKSNRLTNENVPTGIPNLDSKGKEKQQAQTALQTAEPTLSGEPNAQFTLSGSVDGRTTKDEAISVQNAGTIDSVTVSQSAAWRDVSTLPIFFPPLANVQGGIGLAKVPYNFSPIKSVREPRFAFGLQVAASNYSPELDSTKRQWGVTAGWYAAYWLRPAWSLATGLTWRGQPASNRLTDTLSMTHQLRYRFGYEAETFEQTNRRLNFIELPLSLRWHHRAWQVEAGAVYGRLLGARATLVHTSQSSLSPLPTTTEKSVRGRKDGYNQHYTAPFVGLGWQPLRFLHLEVRASHRSNSLLRTTVEQPDHAGTWRLEAGLRWQLFSKERIRVKR